ncbi:MID1 [Branchiostoma lanceolatum]|uniref:MID1 protein n=1 Tax=Branchiostoma lanceolatum TaxID=7740 RepID=A0A8J9YMI7_BRALA|nr:MID1 [Branchiostoma lanceolatum]
MEASKTCVTCRASYCAQCLSTMHPTRGPLASHELVEPTTKTEKPRAVTCPDHKNERLNMFCLTDEAPVCSLCKLVGKHKEHDMEDLGQVFEKNFAVLTNNFERLKGKLKSMREGLAQMEKFREGISQRVTQLKSNVKDECKKLIEIIQQREIGMLRGVDKAQETEEDALQAFLERTWNNERKVGALVTYVTEVLKERDAAAFLQTWKTLNTYVQKAFQLPELKDDAVWQQVEHQSLDFSCAAHMLHQLDFGRPHKAPAILLDRCWTTMCAASLQWTADDADVTFDVRYAKSAMDVTEEVWTAVENVRGFSCTVRGLDSDSNYRFVVIAKNGVTTTSSHELELTTKPFVFALDPNTAHKQLRLSENNTCATYVPGSDVLLPDLPFRFVDQKFSVLGDTGVTSGRHYWQVVVDDNWCTVGVAHRWTPRDQHVGSTLQSWALCICNRDDIGVVLHGPTGASFTLGCVFRTIGVLLDHDAGTVTLSDAQTGRLIHVFKDCLFTEPVYPALSVSGCLTVISGVPNPWAQTICTSPV